MTYCITLAIIQSPLGEKVRDLFRLAVVPNPKIGLKRINDDLIEITKDLLLQVHPRGYSPAGLVRLPTRVAADSPRQSNYRSC